MGDWNVGQTMERLHSGWEHLPVATQNHIRAVINKAFELGKESVQKMDKAAD